jgi:frataxin-like iron-binding protein CyaY
MPIAQSSHLQAYDYDVESGVLTVTFQNGSIYQYSGVPPQDYQKLVSAGGAGATFWAVIRSKYEGAKISGPTS